MLKKIFIIAISFTLLSCASNLDNLTKKEGQLKSIHNFNGYLALEYMQYSRNLANQHLQHDSRYFAKKGLLASQNKPPLPETTDQWHLDVSQIDEATVARQKLLNLLYNPEATKELPIQLAHLQLLYDCWISTAQEPTQIASTGKCKVLFYRLNKEMDDYLENLHKPKKDVKVFAIKAPEFTRFDVYFDLNSYKFNSAADKTFSELFQYLGSLNGDYKIMLVGGADRLGKKLYNDIIAKRRVQNSLDRLVKNGIAQNLIIVKSFGPDNPEIITVDNQQNKNNRRVSIYVLKGQKEDLDKMPLPLIDNYVYTKEVNQAKQQRGVK